MTRFARQSATGDATAKALRQNEPSPSCRNAPQRSEQERRVAVLRRARLFQGMDAADVDSILTCLGARERSFAKGEAVLRSGEAVRAVGVTLSGSVLVTAEDFWGNRSIIEHVGEAEAFGLAFACLGKAARFTVTAAEPARILFLDIERVMASCTSACRFHQQLIRNLASTLATKNLELSRTAGILAQRTIRGKVLEYLSDQARQAGTSAFSIPLTRQQMADLLAVDRSSLSVELSKMRNDGLIRFNRNRFELL